MLHSRQKDLLLAVIENLPTLSFFTLLYMTNDLRISGWASAMLAAIVVFGYLAKALKAHSILLGINIYTLIITPTVETLVLFDLDRLAETLVEAAQPSILITIFVTGCVLTALSKTGFVGASCGDRKTVLRYSAILLVLSLLTVIWSFAIEAERFMKIGLPLIALFGTRQFLVARIMDQKKTGIDHSVMGIAALHAPDSGTDLLV